MNLRRLRFIAHLAITATVVAACGSTAAPTISTNRPAQTDSTEVQATRSTVSELTPTVGQAATPGLIPTTQAANAQSFLMRIDDVSVIKGRGTLVMGRVAQGTIQAGAEVEIIGPEDTRLKTVVTGIEILQKTQNQATAGDTVGILVRGINVEDVMAGMVLTQAGSFTSYAEALRHLK